MPNTPHPNPVDLWRNRRRMAYMSFVALVALGAAAWRMPVEQLEAASSLLITLAWVWGAVILTYVGAATMSDIAALKSGGQEPRHTGRRSFSRWDDERDL